MKRILILQSHPKENSFCDALVNEYIKGAIGSGNKIEILNLINLKLEKFLHYEHREVPTLSKDLLEAQKLLLWANHLVFVYPTWWATPPALLKLFIEIVFHSGFAYKYQKTNGPVPRWSKLLSNKSACIMTTMDSPIWYYVWFVGDPGFKMMKDILNFCGIKPVYKHYFGSIKMSTKEQRVRWLKKAYFIGKKII
jgi:NAD(P)H dehydrogenase (quinone)